MLHQFYRLKTKWLCHMTDGLATEGETDTQNILANISATAHHNVSVFTVGVVIVANYMIMEGLAESCAA